MAFRPRYANNQTTFNLGLSATLREQPNNLQPWPFGHATRTTRQLSTRQPSTRQPSTRQPSTLAFRPRYANN
ncbi:MAG: hypothetical protein F6J90_33260 [Moorea sp. SIOASIH]|uniref:hypothetical protein n=1 Tax=Moorena sp. SIOASIH TaxID=2607817 RepID=UPI0013BBCE7D|nr:hypothetical protein [Moorena sp. SIOASIH]NEO40941.1 hypothetical protein [Moorena sp. SIOASIH]